VALYRILSFDGGGIRGLLSTVLLERLIEESAARDFILSVDMFAGSSTGALIALGLAAEIPLAVIKDLYIEAGPKIFADKVFDQIRDIGNLLGSQYSNKELGRWLHEIFGSRTLGDLKRKVIVPAFELDNVRDLQPGEPRRMKAKIFHNLPNREADNDRLLRDVALYTCSAPTLFPVADGFIDGAVVANNPSLCALAQALDRRWWSHPHLDDVRLLSIGSGQRITYLEGSRHNWGVVQWGSKIIPILMESSQEITDFQCSQILGRSQYCRVQPIFHENFRIDSADRIPDIQEFAHAKVDLVPAINWINENWQPGVWTRLLKRAWGGQVKSKN
jgi:patatin-like phospholipase/acyl hydrolase